MILAVFGGTGLLAYVLMWWLMPAADSTGATAGREWNLQALRRSITDRQFEGVCGGLGEYTTIPSWLWRVAFVGAIFAGGAGLLAYVLLWVFVPKAEATISGV